MIPESVQRFSDKIMLQEPARPDDDLIPPAAPMR
jgi:hypothetical protein